MIRGKNVIGAAIAVCTPLLILILFFCLHTRDNRDDYTGMRKAMADQLVIYGIKDRRVLSAMSKVRRHLFIPENYRGLCNPYGNHPCPIGHGQTISQPYMVAYMTERLGIKPGEKVLEIGTGSGYQAAVLAEMGASVTTVEIIKELVEHSKRIISGEGYKDVTVIRSSGFDGYPGNAPYDAVIVTCAPREIPAALIDQMTDEGRMILPVGKYFQKLLFLKKSGGKISVSREMDVRFVPMVDRTDPD